MSSKEKFNCILTLRLIPSYAAGTQLLTVVEVIEEVVGLEAASRGEGLTGSVISSVPEGVLSRCSLSHYFN